MTIPNAPLRVCHLLRPAEGGMITQVRALLKSAEFGAPLLAAPPDVLNALAEAVPPAANRFALDLAPNGGPKALLRAGGRAGRWAKQRGATVLHGHGLRLLPLFAAASVSSGLPLVVTLHNLVPNDLSPGARVVLRACLLRARRVIAVSHAVAQSAGRAGIIARASARLVVVHNGVDTSRFSAPDAATRREAVRRALKIEDDASPIVLCVARLSPEKGVATFLEAASLLRARAGKAGAPLESGVRFVVAGDGPLRPALSVQADRLGLRGTAQLLGARTDIPDLLAAADIFCLPSREEGLSLAVIEAMASGLPVVASRVGGVPELVDDDVTGLLVSPGNPVQLARALEILLADLPAARAMGARGRTRACAHFSEVAMLAQTRAVYVQATMRWRHK